MFHRLIGLAALCATMLAGGQAAAQGVCTRTTLQAAVDSYIAAQTKGDPTIMALGDSLKYVENRKDADINTGILKSAQKIDFSRSLLDTADCETFTEVIITDPTHPYVLGTSLRVIGGKVTEIDSLVTDEGDWLFNPANDLKISPAQNWGVIPEAQRDDRITLIAAANAYFDYFNDKSVKVPWGKPCQRLEGGLLTGKGKPDDTCNVGVPNNVKITDRHFIVDPDIGAVVGLVNFGGQSDANGLPDSHLFRVEKGKIRFIHTITVCSIPNCGFPPPPTSGSTTQAPPASGATTAAPAMSGASTSAPPK